MRILRRQLMEESRRVVVGSPVIGSVGMPIDVKIDAVVVRLTESAVRHGETPDIVQEEEKRKEN